MKIGLFSDAHYSSAALTCERRYNNKSLGKIEGAYRFFEREGCALAVCLGDLIDTEATVEQEKENLARVGQVIRQSTVPTVCLMGNHDAFVLERAEFYEILGLSPVEELHLDGRRLLFLDTCYFKDGRHYAPGDRDWTDCFLPRAEELRERLAAGGDTYLFLHQNIDPAVMENHRLGNADHVFSVIRESGRVKAVFQGHFHPGCRSEYDGISYITLPAMCESEGAYFAIEI